ncbi:MAG TPA: hypothetical protein LFV90_00055 [Rickettsia endosymbiont of Columbicola hoogstraali]|nr:hypothetical protein [Rickettsia endosymbiont of Columbicola hoogstraali]
MVCDANHNWCGIDIFLIPSIITTIILFIVLIATIFITCKKGTSGSNRYGKPTMD